MDQRWYDWRHTARRDINPGEVYDDGYYQFPAPGALIEVSGKLLFTADDGISGRELWVSDGTA